ncbi:MAG: lanthionine synthetase LanC family protein [Nostocaceae cyanobacterium]|nr:lanthionine synthetase LanC family protein [Nostocaceae cyanobacterium]
MCDINLTHNFLDNQTITNISHSTNDYYQLLTELGINAYLQFPWLMVGETNLTQGWKLHISSIPTEAAKLLAIVVPVLQEYQVPFKVATNDLVLSQLNEGHLGETQIGKFITIYPGSDNDAKNLAEILIKITSGFSGPVIPSDLRLGDVVYTRYGGFKSIQYQDRLGLSFPAIYASDGSLIRDSYTVPFVPPEGIPNPFTNFSFSSEQHSHQQFGSGYLFLELIKQHPKGAVFRVLDVRSQENVGIKIIKQGRKYCVSDKYGRDVRTRLKYQEYLHKSLSGLVPIPQVDDYFEVNGDGYLPFEYIEGQSLDEFASNFLANRCWGSLTNQEQIQLLAYLEKIIAAIQKLHASGYVHRDLTGANIWIGSDEKVYLLDLELTHAVADKSPVFVLGTPGFMSPQQASGMAPLFADDIYSLGCLMISLLTGLPPHLVLFAGEENRVNQLLGLTNGALIELIEVVAKCVKDDAQERPGLEIVQSAIQRCKKRNVSRKDAKTQRDKAAVTTKFINLKNIIFKAQQGLIDAVVTDAETGLWLSSSVNSISHPDINIAQSYEVRRSANIGVAGVVYLLSRLARFGYGTEAVENRVKSAINWLLNDKKAADKGLPGLHFGEAGVAVAITEAIAGGIIERNSEIDGFLVQALSGKLDWYDITHGAAGQGVAALYCGDRLQDKRLLNLSHRCADYLIKTQKDDGSWSAPSGVDNMSGQTMTGFAHGVSGIVYFLAEYAHRFGSNDAERAWLSGADWLFAGAMLSDDEQALEWYHSDVRQEKWKWWCHGAPGIALTFLRLYELTGNEAFAEIATHALQVHSVDIKYRNLSQCHGLSGLGDIYLEAARVLGDQQWLERANAIANTLFYLRRETDSNGVTWLVENFHQPTADLMVGVSGVVHFFLRLSLSEEKIGFPLLLDPII